MQRSVLRWGGAGLAIIAFAVAAPAASATPVTIDFETGATLHQPVTSQYGPDGMGGGILAGPVFMKGTDAGFSAGSAPGSSGLSCGPPYLDNTYLAHSGSNTIVLSCGGGELPTTATFFRMGYSTHAIDFWVGVTGGTPSSCMNYICEEIWTTAFRADKSIVMQEQTLLGPNTFYKDVPLVSNAADIAYVAIEKGVKSTPNDSDTGVTLVGGGKTLLVDDLTYDPPSSPPASSFLIGANPTHVRVAQGQQSPQIKIPINWTNNSNPSASPVSLELSAPAGITGSFMPTTTGSSMSTLTLQVAKDMPMGTQNVTVTGYVDKGTVTEKHASVTIPVDVVAPFLVTPLGNYSAAPCSTLDIGVSVATDQAFTDPVDVSFALSQPGTTIQSASPGTIWAPGYATAHLTQGNRTMVVTLAVAPGTAPQAARQINVTANASGYATQFVNGMFAVSGGDITDVLYGGTNVPFQSYVPVLSPGGFMRPATKVDLRGHGFCPGSIVQFGADSGGATPSYISPHGDSLSVTVPRDAIDGPIRVVPGGGGGPIVGKTVPVNNFRARYGLQFQNKGAPNNFTYKQFEQVFGYAAMHVTVDICAGLTLGLAHCPAVTPFPDPLALIIKIALEGKGKEGLCYGFSRTVGQFAFGADLLGFPPGNAMFPNGLDEPAWVHVPGGLLDRIEINHIQQFDENVIKAWSETIVANWGHTPAERAASLRQRIIDELGAKPSSRAGGQPPILSMQVEGAGHAVLAYDIEDLGGGMFKIDLLDPNWPFTHVEAGDGSHAGRQATGAIVVDPANDRWTFNGGLKKKDGTPWSGNLDGHSLFMLPLAVTYDSQPKLPGLGSLPYLVTLASDGARLGQVTDASGRRLLDVGGGQQAGAQAIPGAVEIPPTDAAAGPNPMALLPRGGVYTITGARTSGGKLTAIGEGFVADATTANATGAGAAVAASRRGARAAAAPASDQLRVNGAAHEATLTPGAAGATGMTLAARAGSGQTRSVALEGLSTAGASDSVRIAADGSVELGHTGRAAARTLTLSWTGETAKPSIVVLRGLRLGSGERMTLRVAWRHLGKPINGVARRGGKVRRLRLHAHSSAAALLGRVQLSIGRARNGAVTLTASLARRGRMPWQTGGVTFMIVHGAHVLARQTVGLATAQLAGGQPTLSWTVPHLAAGVYRALAIATATAIGRDELPRSDVRAARARLRVG